MASILNLIVMMLSVLISVAFLTLLERKILGYIQMRKGPNKASIMGLLQPIADAIKLISKEWSFLYVNKILFMFSPLLMITLSMLMWFLYPWSNNYLLNNSFMLLIALLGLNVYPVMLIGWVSNNNYAMLGSIRSIAQMISFEISLFLMFFILMMLTESYSLKDLYKSQYSFKFVMLILPVYLFFFTSMLIELNRTPFDLIEGESELVSGFNVEYYSSFFTLIFLAEYSSIIFMSYIMSVMFFGMKINSLQFVILLMFHMMLIIWMRGVLPRIRYDKLMMMCWTDFLMITMMYNLYIYLIKEIMMNMN
uniref:NADH-ubiquinone oxidoreductase chain 1 n=1 Tax=Amegilla calceifera TaxID=597987 RepID=A0A7U0R6S2_9HYME|nr:NADH dehydrogenase subunit 1 [Amegilla calceifera]QQX28011.1 NADH dehydrogenase subunit 1 [Amegilla calceifera]